MAVVGWLAKGVGANLAHYVIGWFTDCDCSSPFGKASPVLGGLITGITISGRRFWV